MDKCNHFEWMDDYILRLQRKGVIDSRCDYIRELDLPSSMQNLQPAMQTLVGDVDLRRELQKMNKNLKQMI